MKVSDNDEDCKAMCARSRGRWSLPPSTPGGSHRLLFSAHRITVFSSASTESPASPHHALLFSSRSFLVCFVFQIRFLLLDHFLLCFLFCFSLHKCDFRRERSTSCFMHSESSLCRLQATSYSCSRERSTYVSDFIFLPFYLNHGAVSLR